MKYEESLDLLELCVGLREAKHQPLEGVGQFPIVELRHCANTQLSSEFFREFLQGRRKCICFTSILFVLLPSSMLFFPNPSMKMIRVNLQFTRYMEEMDDSSPMCRHLRGRMQRGVDMCQLE